MVRLSSGELKIESANLPVRNTRKLLSARYVYIAVTLSALNTSKDSPVILPKIVCRGGSTFLGSASYSAAPDYELTSPQSLLTHIFFISSLIRSLLQLILSYYSTNTKGK
jgi:hypothetical protein